MLQWFIRFPEFTDFNAPFRKNSTEPLFMAIELRNEKMYISGIFPPIQTDRIKKKINTSSECSFGSL